ncbi:unnamed protein product, partial [Citrullus colocynthis]
GLSLSKALITGAEAKAKNGTVDEAMLCKPKTLDHSKVKGKILVCLKGDNARVEKGEEAALAGAAGMILCNDKLSGFQTIADFHVLPASHINYNDGQAVFSYINSTNGLVGLLRALHPDWSPSAIKSAIMTSARVGDNTMKPMLDGGSPATPFAYGSAHIHPTGAIDPGLVYDLSPNDYLEFLCASGYYHNTIQALSDAPFNCPASASILNFNYPSIGVQNLNPSVTLTRKLMNVGTPGVYTARILHPNGVKVFVKPNVLKFERLAEEKQFEVTMIGVVPKNQLVDGVLIWTDGKHFVRSPILVSSGFF